MELADYSLDYEIIERFQKKHFFSNKSLYYLLYDLVSALSYMQKIKISHRDIKPHNILKINGVYKMSDFGVSKFDYTNTIVNKTLIGSSQYLAPIMKLLYDKKQRKVSHNSFKSDAFSLGLVILCAASMTDIKGLNDDE